MKHCSCSDRPLGILQSRVVMENGVPYQQLAFGCTNKNCKDYKMIKYHKLINLLDNSDVIERAAQ